MKEQAGILNPDQPLPTLFQGVVSEHGDRLAVCDGDAVLTYSELDERSDRVAGALVAAGIEPGSRVALLLNQGAAFVSGLLGVLKAGAAFVPLDPSYPADRNRFMANDSGAATLLTQTASNEAVVALGGSLPIINLDRLPSEPATTVHIGPDDLAYILYTSGSTGRPKGVMQPHRSVAHNAGRHHRYFDLGPDDRQTLLYPCSVYGGIRDVFNALLSGAGLYHYPVREAGYAGLTDWLAEHRITVYCSVASVFRQFARRLTGAGLYRHLKIVKLGGEAPYATDLSLFREHFCPDTVLFCGLASTETGMSRRYPLRANSQLDSNAIPLGYPVDGMDVILVDESRDPVTPGEIGEIAIRSRYITVGYCGRDDLNAQVLASCPDDPDARIFYTGDLGQIDDDGRLWHRGRKDQQVKIRGNRIELVEVEAAVAAHPSVSDAVALAEPDADGGARLVGYVVIESSAEAPTVADLRDAMKDRVPRFMIPSEFRRVQTIPLTPNGKIDRRALPGAAHEPLPIGRTFRSPSTPTQQRVADIFVAMLGLDRVSVTDTFFDLGGDSLAAVDLVLRIQGEFGRAPTVAALISMATVEELAGWLDGPSSDQHRGCLVLNEPAGATRPPLVFFPGKGGSGMAFLAVTQRIEQDRPMYCLQYPGLDADEKPMDRIEPLVDLLIDRLQERLPEGPVALIGYSFGGLVAYEAACRLSEQGRPIDRLVLIDTRIPGIRRRRGAVRRMLAHAQILRQRSGARRWEYLIDRIGRRDQTDAAGGRLSERDQLRRRLKEIARANERAAARFSPRPYAGAMELIQCTVRREWEMFYDIPDDYGWSTVCTGPIRRYPIDSLHNDVMRPQQIEPISRAIREALA